MDNLLLCWRYLRTRYIALASAMSIALSSASGCVKFEHSLAENREAIVDDEFVGVWQIQYQARPDQLEVSALPDGEYRIRCLNDSGEDYCDFVLVEAAGSTYLEMVRARSKGVVSPRADMLWTFPVRYERRGEWIALDGIDVAALKAAINEGQGLRTAPEKSSRMLLYVTSTPAEIEEFLSAHANDVFRERRVYRRISVDDAATENSVDVE